MDEEYEPNEMIIQMEKETLLILSEPHDKNKSNIRYLIEFLDELQNAHLTELAELLSDYIIQYNKLIPPHFKLWNMDPNFIHFFCGYFIVKCSDDLVENLKEELWKVIERIDYTEYTDLLIIKSLLKRKLYVPELRAAIATKKSEMEQAKKAGTLNINIIRYYLEELNKLNPLLSLL